MAHHAVGKARKQRWVRRQVAAGLGHVPTVVQAHAKDLARRWHGRQPLQAGQGPTGHAVGAGRAGDLVHARFQAGNDVGPYVGQHHDVGVSHDAPGVTPGFHEADQLHSCLLCLRP
ncbi:hypothetical protein D3C72_1360830 [compost metagenome]